MSDTTLRATAWLLTYALHSTVLLGIAALLTARWVRGEAWRETLWKAALLGGLVTATAQSAGWMDGDLGRWRLAILPAAEIPAATPTVLAPASDPDASPASGSLSDAATSSIPPTNETSAAAPSVSTDAAPTAVDPSPVPRRTPLQWAMLAWAAGAAALLARLAWRQLRLRRLLRGRAPVTDGAVLAMLAELRRNAGIWRPVQLTVCPASPTPLALGSGEICVPPRFLADLDPEQQRSALAHELAHLARRDPAWHFGVSVLEALLFFQPLNRLARARLRESAEFLCDAWAARQTGSPLGLARCLAEVASWVAPGRHPVPAGTMAMAEGGSPLVQRVQRLTAWRGEPREGSGFLRAAAALVLVSTVAAIAPAIASQDAARSEDPSSSTPSSTGLPSTSFTSPAGEGQEIIVIRHPDPSAPLSRRWAWGLEEIGRRRLERAWIAWSVPTSLSPGDTWLPRSSEGERMTVNRRLGAPAGDFMLLFTMARDGQLEHAVGHTAQVDLSEHPVVWLGPARSDESFAQLRRLADGLRDPTQREHLVEAVGIHDAAGVVPYLAAVLGRDGSNGVRREAAFALGRHRTAEALAALRTAVERDGSEEVRSEAVDAIGRMGTEEAGDGLRELAFDGRDAAVRAGAAEALGRSETARGLETLAELALGDSDPVVAQEAVEALGRHPAAESGPVLVRIAWTSGNTLVARQAAESLGRLPGGWGIVPLDSIARRHPDGVVAREAVESLGRHSPDVVNQYLLRIARRHRDLSVREEAMDQLRHDREEAMDQRRRDRTEPDTDGEVDPDVDNESGQFEPDTDPEPDLDRISSARPSRTSTRAGGEARP